MQGALGMNISDRVWLTVDGNNQKLTQYAYSSKDGILFVSLHGGCYYDFPFTYDWISSEIKLTP